MTKASDLRTLDALQDAIAKHYESNFDFESERLTVHSPVELAITERYLAKFLPEYGHVADIGVGAGHYAELVASKHCQLHLVDISAKFLTATCSRLEKAGFKNQIASTFKGSAVALEAIPSAACDAVLLLGPLYHLCTDNERRAAVDEASRILKPDGILFAAGINRLAYFRDLLRESPTKVAERQAFHSQFLSNGNLNPSNAPMIGFAHLTTVAEFRELFDAKFEEIVLVGVESFSASWQKSLVSMPAVERGAWLEVIDQTATTVEGLAASDHFLFIGKKSA